MSRFELKVPPLLLVLLLAAAMWGAAQELPALAFMLPGRAALAAVLAGAGLLVAVAGVAAFRRSHTTVDPTRPDRASALVVRGIYRHSRNPMYLGFLLLLAAWAVFLSHGLAFIALPAFVAWMNRFQIAPEERALRARFGAAFDDYARAVRRWV